MQLRRIIFGVCTVAAALAGCETPSESQHAFELSDAAQGSTPSGKAAVITLDRARNLASGCFACHGPNGRSPGYIPSLTTLSAADIAAKLKRFKNDEVSSTIMGRQAKGYSDAEIDAIARYIA